MLKPPTKAVVTVGAATVLAFGAAGLSVARSGTDAATQSTPPGSPTGTTPRGPAPGGGPGAKHEHRIDTLADELGVDVAKLRDALDAVREQQRPTRGSKDDRRSEHRDALA